MTLENLYAIHITPPSLIEPNPIGYVLAEDAWHARRRTGRVMKIGFDVQLYPVWAKEPARG